MTFREISQLIMHGERIESIHLRVVYYARVSTDSEIQLNSLDNQLSYYEKYIKSKPNWLFIRGYIDEGISGVSVDKRTAFKQMIEDAKLNKFDLIITKEVSRFARDLEDSIHYIRLLKEANVGIYFENQNLHTFDPNSELILNIMFNLAQEESRKLSSRIKFGHNQAINNGHVLGSSNILGYQKNNCKLVIDEEEAKVIKLIFELYASGEYGFYKLSKKLGTYGYFNSHGHFYDKDTLKRIIENPKYKGYYRGKTTEVIDYRTKKRIKIANDQQVIYKSDDERIPAIVSEELWNQANGVLKQRTSKYLNNKGYSGGLKYPLSSKIICQDDGCHYQRSHGKKGRNRPTWSCGQYLKYRKDACLSPIIHEKDLELIMQQILSFLIPNTKYLTEDLLMIYQNNEIKDKSKKTIIQLEKKITKLDNHKRVLLDLIYNKEISKSELVTQFKRLDQEIIKLKDMQKRIINQEKSRKLNISEIKKNIYNDIESNLVSDFIKRFVNKIEVSKINNNRHHIKLNIYLENINCQKSNDLILENQHWQDCNTDKKKEFQNLYLFNAYTLDV